MRRARWVLVLLGVLLLTGLRLRLGFAAGLSVSSQGLTAYRTCTITATPTTTSSVSDASVRQASGASNYGTATTENVASGIGQDRRLYLRFDLGSCSPTIDPGAIIRLATLRLYATALPTVCRTVDIFRAATSWTETGLTWNNQPFGTTTNNPPASAASDAFTVGTPIGCGTRSAGYVTGAIVTSDVASFVSGASTNRGWMLRDDVEDSSTTSTSTYAAKELGTLAEAPQLVVTYVLVP